MGPVYIVDLVAPPGPPGPAAAPAATPAAAPAPAAPPKAATPPKASVKTPPPAKKPVEKAIVLPDKNAKKTPDKKAIEKKPVDKNPEPVKNSEASEPEVKPSAKTNETAKPDNAPEPPPTANTRPAAVTPGGAQAGTGTTSTNGAAVGAGGAGTGTGGGGDAYNFYLAFLKRAIEKAWNRPVYTGADTKSATVSLSLSRAGRVLKLELSQPSGYEPLDRSLLRAVRDAEPFPAFPADLTIETLSPQIVFDLKPEGADTGDHGD
ncbi:MAG TPA: TonB family protein, partial [Dongiaceae bacterium]|nr:TonB family protein [Dongiaceae bacterium]